MEITSSLIQFNERLAVCSVTVRSETGSVTLHASALASESERYTDLAQARALTMAKQVLQGGLQALTIEPPSAMPSSTPVPGALPSPLSAPTLLPVPQPPPTIPGPPVSPPPSGGMPASVTAPAPVAPPAPAAAPAVEPSTPAEPSETDKTVMDIPW